MSALSNLTQTSGSSVTSLPDWYNTAQQNLVTGATNAAAAAPQLGQTVAQGAINTLSGPNNPFTTATNTLGNIAAGAANPWITDPTTGAVTPNTSTAMGGLFQAQRNQLEGEMPYIAAGAAAPSIGSGGFGSLRGQVATDVAMGDAMNKLFSNQQQSALQNQQVGTTAAANMGNVAQQGITNAMNVGKEEMVAPFTTTANMGNILASINAPSTVNTTQTPSLLQSLTGTGTALSGGLNALYGKEGANQILQNVGNTISGGLGKIFGGGSNMPAPVLSGADASSSGGTMDAETAAAMGYVQNPYGEGYVDPTTLEQGP